MFRLANECALNGRMQPQLSVSLTDAHSAELVRHLSDSGNGHAPKGFVGFPARHVNNSLIIEWQGVLRTRGNRNTTVQTKVTSIRTFLHWSMNEERKHC